MSWLLFSILARIGGAVVGRGLASVGDGALVEPEQAPLAAAVDTGDGPRALRPSPRTRHDPVAEVRQHLGTAAAQGGGGALLAVIGCLLLPGPSELVGFACVMGGGYLCAVAFGRVWAVGGVRAERWAGAAVSVWHVEGVDDDEDFEGFCRWFYLRLKLLDAGTADPERTELSTDVRFFPATPGTKSDWKARSVQVLEMPGIAVVGLVGHRYHRMGGDSPWDFIDRWDTGSRVSHGPQRRSEPLDKFPRWWP